MNTKGLLLGAVVTAFTCTTFAAAPLLSPRAVSNQIKLAGGPAPAVAAGGAESTAPAQLSPRAQGDLIQVVPGVANDRNPALECRRNMSGTPKAVAECSSQTTMPGCIKLAAMK